MHGTSSEIELEVSKENSVNTRHSMQDGSESSCKNAPSNAKLVVATIIYRLCY